MSAFLRRFSVMPDLSVLTEIESVVVIDEPPPGQIQGVGTGTVLEVGEFEDGPFATPTEVFGGADLLAKFGGFGFSYDGIPSQNPCARSRKPDGQTSPEYWSGSAFIHLASCRFSRLFACRVDTSVGKVSFSRLASLSGTTTPTFDLEPGQVVVLNLDGGPNDTATFDAAAATILSANGTYPSTFVGGETMTFAIKDANGVVQTNVATFAAGDQTQAQVISRLNAAAGYTAFAIDGAPKTRLTGIIRGTSGTVQIVAVSGALVTTATGFTPAAAVSGTGDVGNIDRVTDAEANAVIFADTGARVDRDAAGKIRIYSPTELTGAIEVDSTTTATAFGWATETEASAATGVDGKIPAGTRVKNAAGTRELVTMRTLAVTAATAGPYEVEVRHALDDQTGLSASAGAIDTLEAPIEIGAFAVTNDASISAALTDSQIDARYLTAIATTRSLTGKKTTGRVREVNLIMSARASNAVRSALKQNALDASANGCRGRVALLRPPLGTTRDLALGSSQPGVGSYRDAGLGRAVYCFPGVQKLIPEILARGTDGGVGFTADGLVDHGWDAGVACLASALNPEEDVGQSTSGLVDWVVGLEAGNADVQDLRMEDYVAFKAAGIAAPRIDGGVTLQSSVTTVDSILYPGAAPLNRRRFTDFASDSTAEYSRAFAKKLSTIDRRALLVSRIDTFYSLLGSRIEGRRISGGKDAGNTPDTLARNLFFVLQKVRMTPTLGTIVLRMQVGNDVQIEEE